MAQRTRRITPGVAVKTTARMRRGASPRSLQNYDDSDEVDIPETALGPGKTGAASLS